MAKASTREYCRECGKETLYKVTTKAPGFILWKVICKECQDAIATIASE